jgi:hypothetical protein
MKYVLFMLLKDIWKYDSRKQKYIPNKNFPTSDSLTIYL